MKKFRFSVDIEADNETEAREEFSEVLGYDFNGKDQWLEVAVEEVKEK
jgi:hypothetical protein